MLTQAELKSQLHYNPDTGIFTWTVSKSRTAKSGYIAGTLHHEGYITIGVNGNVYPSHRLAWLYVYGEFPIDKIDHINQIRNDNRIVNLRDCNNSENLKNIKIYSSNTSGYKGVSYHKLSGRWSATAQLNSKQYHLGLFATKELASKKYNDFCKVNHGIFYHPTHLESNQRVVIK